MYSGFVNLRCYTAVIPYLNDIHNKRLVQFGRKGLTEL